MEANEVSVLRHSKKTKSQGDEWEKKHRQRNAREEASRAMEALNGTVITSIVLLPFHGKCEIAGRI